MEAVRGIATWGGGFSQPWEDKLSQIACLLLIELPCGTLTGGGRHEELFRSCPSPDTIVGRTLPRAHVLLPWPLALTVEVVDTLGGVLLDGAPLGNHLPVVCCARGW